MGCCGTASQAAQPVDPTAASVNGGSFSDRALDEKRVHRVEEQVAAASRGAPLQAYGEAGMSGCEVRNFEDDAVMDELQDQASTGMDKPMSMSALEKSLKEGHDHSNELDEHHGHDLHGTDPAHKLIRQINQKHDAGIPFHHHEGCSDMKGGVSAAAAAAIAASAKQGLASSKQLQHERKDLAEQTKPKSDEEEPESSEQQPAAGEDRAPLPSATPSQPSPEGHGHKGQHAHAAHEPKRHANPAKTSVDLIDDGRGLGNADVHASAHHAKHHQKHTKDAVEDAGDRDAGDHFDHVVCHNAGDIVVKNAGPVFTGTYRKLDEKNRRPRFKNIHSTAVMSFAKSLYDERVGKWMILVDADASDGEAVFCIECIDFEPPCGKKVKPEIWEHTKDLNRSAEVYKIIHVHKQVKHESPSVVDIDVPDLD